MTRLNMRTVKFFIFLLVFLLARFTASDGNQSDRRAAEKERDEQSNAVLAESGNIANVTSKLLLETENETARATVPPEQHSGEGRMPALNTGALLRGFCVFVGLTILVLAYIVFRSFRLKKTRAQMVRKYGVLAHRQDVEMRPLPLDEEDDEDTTIFDACNVLTNNTRHQNI